MLLTIWIRIARNKSNRLFFRPCATSPKIHQNLFITLWVLFGMGKRTQTGKSTAYLFVRRR